MLEQIEPHQLTEMIAAYHVGLDPEGWMQMGHLAAWIVNKLDEMLAVFEQRQPEVMQPMDFMPLRYHEQLQKTVDKMTDPDEAIQKQFQAMYG
jgi:hypothetical protein